VDDVLQEVFLRIHKNIEVLASSDRVAGWIFKTARNALIDFERARATCSDARQVAADDVELAAVAEHEDRRAAVVPCLKPMIERLPEPYRDGIRMTEIEGFTQAAAAKRAGVSLPGMKSRVQRGRQQLKEMILACCQVEQDVRGGIMDVACGCASGAQGVVAERSSAAAAAGRRGAPR
jgi:RNA polymerase sigma-70 factor (ECF subfamily)